MCPCSNIRTVFPIHGPIIQLEKFSSFPEKMLPASSLHLRSFICLLWRILLDRFIAEKNHKGRSGSFQELFLPLSVAQILHSAENNLAIPGIVNSSLAQINKSMLSELTHSLSVNRSSVNRTSAKGFAPCFCWGSGQFSLLSLNYRPG